MIVAFSATPLGVGEEVGVVARPEERRDMVRSKCLTLHLPIRA
jgi:hypothetical protein